MFILTRGNLTFKTNTQLGVEVIANCCNLKGVVVKDE